MGYRLIGENDLSNPKEQILRNRNITEELLNVGEEAVEDYMNYDNILEGCELLNKHLENGSKILIIADSDTDGLTSSSLLVNYIYREFPMADIIIKYHEGKQHGLSSDIVVGDDIDLVILPDAGTNDRKEVEELYKRGIEVLILDHHELEGEYPKYGVIINNQTSKNVKNKSLSGVGIVYKFLCAFAENYFFDYPYEFIDLVALGNIADAMDSRSLETRYYIKEGLKHINNPFFKALIEEKRLGVGKPINMMDIGWSIAPMINGCIRSGTVLEKQRLYNVMINNEDCSGVAKMCKNAKTRQDNAVKRDMAKIEKTLKIGDNDKVIIASSCGATKTKTGLIAGKLCSKYKLPVFLYSSDGDILAGSARGLGDIDLKEDLNKSGLGSGVGHSLAFGFNFKKEDEQRVKDYFNELYKDIDFGTSNYEVDFEMTAFELYQEFVDEIAEMEGEWGNGLDEPLVVIKDVPLDLTEDNVKGKLNVIWDIYGVKCIKRFASNVWKEEFLNESMFVDIIAKCVIDGYTKKGMLEIVDIIPIK